MRSVAGSLGGSAGAGGSYTAVIASATAGGSAGARIAKPAALSPDGGLAALLEELQYSRREVQGRPAEALQYKQLQDAYHSKCAYHFQADVLPYFCMYPTLWWCGEYNDHELAACLCHSQPLTTHRSPLVTSRRGHVHPHGEA